MTTFVLGNIGIQIGLSLSIILNIDSFTGVLALTIKPLYDKVNDYTDLDSLLIEQIQHFFEHYKKLENGKWVKIEKWLGKKDAEEAIKKAVENYK